MNPRITKTYSSPFTHCLYVEYLSSYCFQCLRQLPTQETESRPIRCSNCHFAVFCSEKCQSECIEQYHHFECPLITKSFPNVPNTHTIFFSRLLYRLKKENVDICAPYEPRPIGPRTWKNLISHEESIRGNEGRMKKFELLKELLNEYFKDAPPESTIPEYTEEELFTIYCKKAVNSHGVFSQCGDCIGESLDFDASIYDHSCRPNLSVTYDGVGITFALLDREKSDPDLLLDPSAVFVSYVELAMSRSHRRRLLKDRYYFDCQCDRCLDLEDDQMTSIKCANPSCNQPLIGISEDGVPVHVTCPVCNTVREKADVRQCQIMMRVIEKLTENWRDLPQSGADAKVTADDIFKKSLAMYDRCKSYLHTTNLYLTDLRLVYVFWAMRTKRNLKVALQFALDCTECVRLCYPEYHKLLGFHLLKIVYLYIIVRDDYHTAKPYLDEAYVIMLRWFGGENSICERMDILARQVHNVVYDEEKVDKEKLLELMKFY